MHILIDAPRWRCAGVNPLVVEVSTIRVDGHHVIIGGGTPFSVTDYEISFVADSQRAAAFNRKLDFQVFQADPV